MRFLQSGAVALARICLSVFFITSSIHKIMYWRETEKEFLAMLADWQVYVSVSLEGMQTAFSFMMLWAPIILMGGTFCEILGALLLFFGIREKLGAGLLAAVLLPATILFQHFWFSEGGERELQMSFFLRNLAIFGGLLLVIVQGAQSKQADAPFSSANF
ncbi:MAG: DoxX family protein [Chlamydiia bacterium]|nr:DoxX family protein [Chlamydiia bacterium]